MADYVTVILPCAGKGSRMGLPFLKELAPLGPGRFLIDSCLDLVRAGSGNIRILLLEDGVREQTAAHIRRRLPGIPLAMIRQHPDAPDMTDGVLMARRWFSDVNILLLPDAVYETQGDPVSSLAQAVIREGCSFGAVLADAEARRTLGALNVIGDHVLSYEDKPADPEPYNAAWTMLGFPGDRTGTDFLQLIAFSASRMAEGPVRVPPVLGAPVIWTGSYRDCGTWDSYLSELRRGQLFRYRQDHGSRVFPGVHEDRGTARS